MSLQYMRRDTIEITGIPSDIRWLRVEIVTHKNDLIGLNWLESEE